MSDRTEGSNQVSWTFTVLSSILLVTPVSLYSSEVLILPKLLYWNLIPSYCCALRVFMLMNKISLFSK